MKKAPKKDRPGLLDDAARLAEAGRRGDKVIAHITPEEAALLKARGGSGTVNPRTGLLEFFEGSTAADSHGSNSSGYSGDSYGGGSAYGGSGSGEGVASGTTGGLYDTLAGVDPFSAPAANQFGPQAMPSYVDTRGFFGGLRDNIQAGLQDMAARPGEALTNLAMGALVPGYSAVNTLVGLTAPGNTLAGFAFDAAKGAGPKSEFMGADETPGAPNGPDGFASDSRGSGEQGQGAPRAFAPMPQQSAEQVAQQALREAIVKPPQAFNTWLGNKMQIPQNPGTPRAFNTWAGNRFQIPGLLS